MAPRNAATKAYIKIMIKRVGDTVKRDRKSDEEERIAK